MFTCAATIARHDLENPISLLRPQADHLPNSVQNTKPGEVIYKLADRRAEREAAFRLVYEAYVRRGLMEPNPYGMRVSSHHLLSTTDVLVAMHGRQVIYTMTLISDNKLGFPLESVYAREVADLRNDGRCVAEVSCLASQENYFALGGMFEVFVRLVALLFQSARANGAEHLVIAVHPRHGRFYQRLLGYRQIGEVKSYSSVRDNQAVALEHNFARLDGERYRLFNRIYGAAFERRELLRKPMSAADREYFAAATTVCGPCRLIAAA